MKIHVLRYFKQVRHHLRVLSDNIRIFNIKNEYILLTSLRLTFDLQIVILMDLRLVPIVSYTLDLSVPIKEGKKNINFTLFHRDFFKRGVMAKRPMTPLFFKMLIL